MPWLHFYEINFTKNRDSTVYDWSGSFTSNQQSLLQLPNSTKEAHKKYWKKEDALNFLPSLRSQLQMVCPVKALFLGIRRLHKALRSPHL